MPRCNSSRPRSRSSNRYLPRRRTPRTVRPTRLSGATPSGQRSGLPRRAPSMRAPAMRSAKLRRVTSTSGSSGMEEGWGRGPWPPRKETVPGSTLERLSRVSDYDLSMMRFPLAALFAALLAAGAIATPALAQPATESVAAAPANSGLDAELFYELLLGELNGQGNEPAAGFALILDAAKRTNDPALYQRAVEMAFEARS